MLTNEEYHARPEIGSTTAKLAIKNHQLYLDALSGIYHVTRTPAMELGTLCHTLVLEPESVEVLWHSEGPINPTTGKPFGVGTKAYDTWLFMNPGHIIVPQKVRTMLDRMPDEICYIFAQQAIREQSFFADIGVSAKARPDHLTDDCLRDLKTTADMDNLEKQISSFNYPFSLEWYARVIGKESIARQLIFAETSPPYRWRIVDLDWEWRDIAKREVDDAIRIISSEPEPEEIHVIATPPVWRTE